jgi:hypothetical protein
MNTYMVATLAYSLSAGTPSLGVSGEALYIGTRSAQTWDQLQRSVSLGNASLFDELEALSEECGQADWDGYGAVGITRETIAQAERVLRSLPLGTSRPSIGAESDGQVTLEWHAAPNRTLSVSVSSDGSLHYAALLGSARQFGTEAFVGQFPRNILALVRRVQQA